MSKLNRLWSLLVLFAFVATSVPAFTPGEAVAGKTTVAKKKRAPVKKKAASRAVKKPARTRKATAGAGTQRWKNKLRKDGQPYRKPGPKTDPNAPHNKKIRQLIRAEKKKGLEHIGGGSKTEVTIATPGGHKPYRRADASFRDPKTGQVFHHNVGLKTQKGRPISRERKALDDVRGAGEKMEFHEYKK